MSKLYNWNGGKTLNLNLMGCNLHYTKTLSQKENCGKYFVVTYLKNILSTKYKQVRNCKETAKEMLHACY